MSSGLRWTFRCFISTGGGNVIKEWYQSEPATVRSAFDTSLKYLRDQPHDKWVRPFTGILSRECAGLVEIRFTVNKVRYRPIGFFGPNRMEFTLVFCATEKDRKFVPPNTCQIALERKAIVLLDPRRANEIDF